MPTDSGSVMPVMLTLRGPADAGASSLETTTAGSGLIVRGTPAYCIIASLIRRKIGAATTPP